MMDQWWITAAFLFTAVLSYVSSRVENLKFRLAVGFITAVILMLGGGFNLFIVEHPYIRIIGLFVFASGCYLVYIYSKWILEERKFTKEVDRLENILKDLEEGRNRIINELMWVRRN